MAIIFCDDCQTKMCISIVGASSRMVFSEEGMLIGVETTTIEGCKARTSDATFLKQRLAQRQSKE